MILGAPFLLFVGAGGSFPRRAVSAGVGLALPLLGLAAFNVVSTGHLFHPAYDYQYRMEAWGYPALGYRPDWAIEDLRYLPQNLALMFGALPDVGPGCGSGGGLFDPSCALLRPNPVGMSILLTSPGWLLALAALRRPRARWAAGALLAVGAIVVFDLMHFSQGWVQFGYRFSLDATPFALPLLVVGIDRLRGSVRGLALAIGLVAASVAVTWWGVAWGVLLHW